MVFHELKSKKFLKKGLSTLNLIFLLHQETCFTKNIMLNHITWIMHILRALLSKNVFLKVYICIGIALKYLNELKQCFYKTNEWDRMSGTNLYVSIPAPNDFEN